MPSGSVWTLLGSAKKRRKCRNGKGERGKRITHLDYDYDDCGFLLHSTVCLVAATPPLDVLWGAHLRLRGCVKLCPAGNNLLEVICSIPEGFSLCPANCRAGNLGFSPSLINCNYLFEILKTAAKTMTTAETPKSSRRSEAAAMAAMGGALEGKRRRNGRGRGEQRRFVGRTMGKSTPIIPSMQLAQCPLLKTLEAK